MTVTFKLSVIYPIFSVLLVTIGLCKCNSGWKTILRGMSEKCTVYVSVLLTVLILHW